jgi:hypothetical protein
VVPGGAKPTAKFKSRFGTLETTWRPNLNNPAAYGAPRPTVRQPPFQRTSATPGDHATAAQRISNCARHVCRAMTRPCADEKSSHLVTPPSLAASVAACGAGSWFIITLRLGRAFREVKPCSMADTGLSEGHTVSIIRVIMFQLQKLISEVENTVCLEVQSDSFRTRPKKMRISQRFPLDFE